jgi:hypothetical protein
MGDTTLRVKLNFWGNDGGPTAFGMMVDRQSTDGERWPRQ